MNKQRRQRLNEGIKKLDEVLDIFKDVLNDEENAFDSLSEGLQQTARGDRMQDNIDILNSSIDSIEEILSDLEDVD